MASYDWPPSQGSGGTVTSIGLVMPAIFSVSGSPVTTNGTITVSLATESANTVFAGPTSGGVLAPTFRALVASDIPSLSATYLPLAGGTMTGNIILASPASIKFPVTTVDGSGALLDSAGVAAVYPDARALTNTAGDNVIDWLNGVILDPAASQTVLDFSARHLVNAAGTTVLGFATTLNVPTLSTSLPVQTNGSKDLVSAAITLSGSQVTGVLGPANGGTGVANNAASTIAVSGNFATTLTVTNVTGVTLPTSGTLATTGGTETLTNKKLVDSSVTFVDNGDATKQLAFECSGISTGTTRTWTVPNSSDTIVGKATTDVFTNKTLTGNTAVNLISGSGTLTLNTTGTITVPNATDTLVGKATTDILTNKTLTGNTAVNLISGSGTLTLNTTGTITIPNATDTVAVLAATQTLAAKTLTTPIVNGFAQAISAVKTANYTLLSTDNLVLGGTNAFNFTLPAANTGRLVYTIRKTTSDFNAITILRAGSDTITDVAGSLTSTTINTQGESITIQSDGSSIWYVICRHVPSIETTYALTIGGSSSAPTLGTTSRNIYSYSRMGRNLKLHLDVAQTGAGSAGSGIYLFPLPSGLTIDSTYTFNGTELSQGLVGAATICVGALGYQGNAYTYNSSNLSLKMQDPTAGSGTLFDVSSANTGLNNTVVSISFTAIFPITGWNG